MRLENVQGWSRGSVTEEELLKMTFEVSHCFEKKVTWRNYYEDINKDRVVKAAELQAVLRGRKETMQQRRAPALALFKMYFCVKGVSPLLRAIITFSKLP